MEAERLSQYHGMRCRVTYGNDITSFSFTGGIGEVGQTLFSAKDESGNGFTRILPIRGKSYSVLEVVPL